MQNDQLPKYKGRREGGGKAVSVTPKGSEKVTSSFETYPLAVNLGREGEHRVPQLSVRTLLVKRPAQGISAQLSTRVMKGVGAEAVHTLAQTVDQWERSLVFRGAGRKSPAQPSCC